MAVSAFQKGTLRARLTVHEASPHVGEHRDIATTGYDIRLTMHCARTGSR